MTVEELLDQLDGLPLHAEIRIASQPSWPFEYAVQGVYAAEAGEPDDDEASDELPVVYLAEGSQLGYLPRTARQTIGW